MSTRPAVAALGDDADVVAALHLQRRGDAGRDRGRVAEERVDPRQLPRRLRVRRREHLEAARRVRRDQPPVRRAHRGVERVARAERLAAALAGAVAGSERVRALRARLHRALLRIEQAVAGREAAHLEELDLLLRHASSSSVRPGGDGADVAEDVLGVWAGAAPLAACGRARARRAPSSGRGT